MELLLGYEGNCFSSTGNIEADILSITSVHSIRADAVEDLLRRSSTAWGTVENLIAEDKLAEVDGGHSFYMRKLSPGYKR